MSRWLFVFFIVIFSSCSNNSNQNEGLSTDVVNNPKTASGVGENKATPQIDFEFEEHDFGDIAQGEKVEYDFKFKNTGGSDLIISNAKGSCGCTIPVWPKEPIPAGGEGIIKVSFNSEGRHGVVDKKVTIVSNTNPNTKIIKISGKIIETEEKKSE
jgi:hypothetical protein